MEIRFAQPEDLQQIAQLYISNHKKTYRGLLADEYLEGLTLEYGLDKWTRYSAEHDGKIWVACDQGNFAGFAAGMEDTSLPDTWYLDSLHVLPEARGKGVGTRLIIEMGRYALENGYAKMSICIVRGNDTAGALYRKLGAKHLMYFEDSFGGTKSQSEKLVWEDLTVFK